MITQLDHPPKGEIPLGPIILEPARRRGILFPCSLECPRTGVHRALRALLSGPTPAPIFECSRPIRRVKSAFGVPSGWASPTLDPPDRP
ncbi:hypothetical protein GCM10023214_06050 [Amycolatopsis dongchuanensis]|uniref:Uncharacterized protein n=1 Tax=Amycolatopsis dongchuanensis TaxID=1070866 RepID=A0ABP9PYS4_9PSEU